MVIEKLRINILVIEKDKEPYELNVRNMLEKFREIIGTNEIEVDILEKDILLIYDANGTKKEIPTNRILNGTYKIRGTFILAGNDEYHQDFIDLSKENMKKYKNEFSIEKEIKNELGDEMEF